MSDLLGQAQWQGGRGAAASAVE